MTKQYESEVLASVHEAALGLAEAGLMSKRTMRRFDEMCLTPVREMMPEDIRALRLRERASQAVFALHLNVTTGLVSQWERGGEASAGSFAETADAGGQERPRRSRLRRGRTAPRSAEDGRRAETCLGNVISST